MVNFGLKKVAAFFIAGLKNSWSTVSNMNQCGRESEHTCKYNFCETLGFLVAENSAMVGVYGM